MADIAPEDAKTLLDNGLISQDTHDNIVGASPSSDLPNPELQTVSGQPTDSAGQPIKDMGSTSDVSQLVPGLPEGSHLTADITPSQANIVSGAISEGGKANTTSTSNASQSQQLGEFSPETHAAVSDLSISTKEAGAGAIQAGKTSEKIGSEAEGQLTEKAKAAAAAAASQKAIEEARAAFMKNQQDGIDTIEKQAALASTNPTEEVFKQMNVGNPILSSLALVLGGIGSGLTGQPNAAMDILTKRVQGAIQTKADELKNAYLKAQAQGKFGEDHLTEAQVEVMSKSVSTQGTIAGLGAASDHIAKHAGYATEPQKAILVKNAINKGLVDSVAPIATAVKTSVTNQDARTLNAYGNGIKALSDMFSNPNPSVVPSGGGGIPFTMPEKATQPKEEPKPPMSKAYTDSKKQEGPK